MKTQCDPIILEAKRVILNEQFEKISNLALSNISFTNKPVRNAFIHIDAPSDKENNTKNLDEYNRTCDSNQIYYSEAFLGVYVQQKLIFHHFNKWKRFAQYQKLHAKDKILTVDQRKKLDDFIETIKEYKKKQCEGQNTQVTVTNKNSKIRSLKRQSSLDICRPKAGNEAKLRAVKTAHPELYKNRFEAQKNIIEKQKMKLEEQEKIIEAMKLGKVQQDLHKSMDAAKNNIREIFQSASVKVKCKVSPILSIGCSEKFLDLELSSQKAPKFVQEMEKRAQERAFKREIIFERKRILDEQRRKITQQAIEAKRTQDEDETRRNLEAIKERRRKELEIEKRRQLNKQKWEQQYRYAETSHNNKLKSKYFTTWVHSVIEVHLYEERCDQMYRISLATKCFHAWTRYCKSIEDRKYVIADMMFNKKIIRRMFECWKTKVIDSRQSMQVSQDLYDMRLENKIFKHWYRFVCTQYMMELKHIQTAEKHYKRRILFQYFYQWKSLPAVLQLEKAKEEKRKKWRDKVWQVLPDYQPPIDI